MEYRDIIAPASAQFEREERSLEAEERALDAAQAKVDRRRKALKRKRAGSQRLLRNFQELDGLVDSGQQVNEGQGAEAAA